MNELELDVTDLLIGFDQEKGHSIREEHDSQNDLSLAYRMVSALIKVLIQNQWIAEHELPVLLSQFHRQLRRSVSLS